MSFAEEDCRYCFAKYKPFNHRVKIECSHEFCQNCIMFLQRNEAFCCPLCYQESEAIHNYIESTINYCMTHNEPHAYFDTKNLISVCEKCVEKSSSIVPYNERVKNLDIKLAKKQMKLKENLGKLNTFYNNLRGFKLILNTNQIYSNIQEFDDFDDIEKKLNVIKQNDLIKFCEAFKKIFDSPDKINEEYMQRAVYGDLEKLLKYIEYLIQ